MRGMTPCTWPVDADCLGDFADTPGLPDAVDAAIVVLWALTGRQFGVCETVARPCPRPAEGGPWFWAQWMVPLLEDGRWRNYSCVPSTRCSRIGESTVLLPGPVHHITKVTVDGADIDPDSWAVEGNWLIRATGTWPSQNLSAPPGTPGTWTVTYGRGIEPPAGAGRHVARLAREFLLSCTDPGKCALPRNTTQIQRQGVTVQMADPQAIIDAGGTGIPEIDLWVRAINPHRLPADSLVWSPELGVN